MEIIDLLREKLEMYKTQISYTDEEEYRRQACEFLLEDILERLLPEVRDAP
jgi:hypothetical protein